MDEKELLFSEVLHCDRISLYLKGKSTLAKEKSAFISSVLKRRFLGEPIHYILGKTEFMGLEFKVDKDVFVPRPETEILVETAVKYVTRSPGHQVTSLNILDLGTGSGCIAISLAKNLANARIDAIDISSKVLKIAKENARLNSVNINFIQSDLFNAYNLTPNTYNLVISNPPYIPTAEIEGLQPEVKYQPLKALDGGEDGLDFYRKIIAQAPQYLKNNGFLILEIGFNQRESIENIFHERKIFEIIEVRKDYNSIERVIVARING